ncbi:MAG: amidohydrolase family protein [Candidatus Promineifilaceae bacterium]|jgi:5-methylthioadenosine/S-adenosylhomocysteine deaminase
MSSLLIENGSVVTLDDEQTVYQKGFVFVEDDLITAVSPGDAPAQMQKADTVIDANLMAIMPGMVNAHTHLFQTFIRGLADDKPLLDWLKTAIWPVASCLTEEEAYLAAMVGMVENIRGGATSVIDHQYIHTEPGNDDGVCRAADESGLRFLLARGWADMDYHPSLMEDPERIIGETIRLREVWHGYDNGRIRVEFGPLIPWGCSDDTMRRTHDISQQWGAGTHIHVAETHTEVEMNLEKRGNRHIQWLHDIGVLGPQMQLVHSIWLDESEIELIAEANAVVVHCPISNMYLASGVAPVPEMLKQGITIALGTDGPGSNNSQDMMELLKTTALLHKVNTLDATVLLPEDVLWMACRGGAVAFGMPDQIGSLEPGKKADLTLVDLDTPLAMPVHRIPSALVYNAGTRDVDTVIVNGRPLMRHKEILFLDEKALLARARQACVDLFARAGVKVSA